MSADIISLQEWRREHREHHRHENEHHRHENMSVSVPFVLPTWPFGWLLPMLVEIDVSIGACDLALTYRAGTDEGGATGDAGQY